MKTGGWWQPVGPLPARTYWLRRLIPLLVVVIVVLVVARSWGGGGSGGGTNGGVSTLPTTASPTPSATSTGVRGGAAGSCSTTQLSVVAATDATTYPSGAQPRFSATVRNTSAQSCRFADAPSRRSWTVFSGSDRVWTTSGCPHSDLVIERTLGPGKPLTTTMLWDRHRSVSGCGTGAAAQPGTYRLYVTVDGLTSGPAVFHLTG